MSLFKFSRRASLCALAFTLAAGAANAADSFTMRAVGNFSSNRLHVENVEAPFFQGLADNTGINIKTTYSPMDQIGVQASDALRLLKSGAFDVMSVQVGQASRDDPFFEGLDLIGVAPNMAELRKAVDAYRKVFDERLQKKFNAKVLTLWPFGPQVFFCNKEIKSLADFKGLKVRSFTPSMAALIEHLGATPVTLSFSEVYPALQRGVVNCGVTAPTAGNSGKWPEVTSHFLPLAVSGSVQGHFVNLNHWKKYSPEQQKKLEAEFKKMEDAMWDLAVTVNDDAANCNTGKEPCTAGQKFNMKLVQVTDADREALKKAVTNVVLPLWKESCNRIDPQCSATWNATVGKAVNLKID